MYFLPVQVLIKRMNLALLLPVVLSILLSAVGALNMRSALLRRGEVAAQTSSLLMLVQNFHREAEVLIGSSRGAVLTDDVGFLEEFKAAETSMQRLGDELRRRLSEPALAPALEQYRRAIAAGNDFIEGSHEALRFRRGRRLSHLEMDSFVSHLRQTMRPKRHSLQFELTKFSETINRLAAENEAHVFRTLRYSSFGFIGFIGLALLGIIYVAARLSAYYVSLNRRTEIAIAQKNASVNLLSASNRELEKITEEVREREEKLASTSEELKRSNEALDQFVSVAAHDLKEPLRMISSYLNLLERKLKGKLSVEEAEFLAFAKDGSRRLGGLLDAMLAYARNTSRAHSLEPVSCEDVLRQAIANLSVAIEEGNAQITHEVLPMALGDAAQLLQVFQNLLSNAIKYRNGNSVRVHISWQERGNELIFSVRDDGSGFVASQSERIFQMFQRLHQNEVPGAGIGLAVCRKIIERHGGKIWAESELGKGSVFHFSLRKIATASQWQGVSCRVRQVGTA